MALPKERQRALAERRRCSCWFWYSGGLAAFVAKLFLIGLVAVLIAGVLAGLFTRGRV